MYLKYCPSTSYNPSPTVTAIMGKHRKLGEALVWEPTSFSNSNKYTATWTKQSNSQNWKHYSWELNALWSDQKEVKPNTAKTDHICYRQLIKDLEKGKFPFRRHHKHIWNFPKKTRIKTRTHFHFILTHRFNESLTGFCAWRITSEKITPCEDIYSIYRVTTQGTFDSYHIQVNTRKEHTTVAILTKEPLNRGIYQY